MDEAVALVGAVKARLWLAYLAGCSIAFTRNTVGIYQTVASHRMRGPAALPPTRADLYEEHTRADMNDPAAKRIDPVDRNVK